MNVGLLVTTDEFIDEDYLYHLKHCELKPSAPLPFSSNAPMYQNDFRWAGSDWKYTFDHHSLVSCFCAGCQGVRQTSTPFLCARV